MVGRHALGLGTRMEGRAVAVISEMVDAPARLSITSAGVHHGGHIVDIFPDVHIRVAVEVDAPWPAPASSTR